MSLGCTQRDFDTNSLMAYELSPVPTSMFDNNGNMRIAKSKADLKNVLKVEVTGRHVDVDVSFLDGCDILFAVPWPMGGTVQDYLNNFCRHVQNYLHYSDVYLLFDR